MSVWIAVALTWAAVALVAWRVRRLEAERSGGPTSSLRKFSHSPPFAFPPPPPIAPHRSGVRPAFKRTWGDPPPLPAEALREENLHPLPPVPTEQTYRARTRVWRP